MLVLQVFSREEWEKSPAMLGQAAFIGETVVFFSEAKAQEGPNSILTPDVVEVLKAGLRPYQE